MAGGLECRRKPRVAHLPWDGVNPYQALLRGALRRQGVDCIKGRPHRFFFFTNIMRWRAEILHVHWPDAFIVNESLPLTLCKTFSFLSQVLMARLCGARVVWTAHDLVSHERHFPLVEDFAMRVFVRLCDAAIVHGPHARRAVLEAYPSLSGAIPEPIPHGPMGEAYPPLPPRIRARRELGIHDDEFVLLHFGQIRRYKGTERLVRAFKDLSGIPGVRLIIAGHPRDAGFARELAQECAGTAGIDLQPSRTTADRAALLFAACDAVILPYSAGLTSGVAELSRAYGRTCVATRTVAALDAFGEDEAVFLDAVDTECLAGAISSIRNARVGRKVVHTRTSWEEVAAATRAVYSRLLSRP